MDVWTYWFTIHHVWDGDTCMGVLDVGLGIYLGREPGPLYSIRLAGINTPEINAPDPVVRQVAIDARDYLRSLVQPGDVCRVDSVSWDKYSRRIDAILTSPSGVNLNQAMLDSGHAVVYP